MIIDEYIRYFGTYTGIKKYRIEDFMIPLELKKFHNWCSWKVVNKTKKPIQHDGNFCSSTDKRTWNSWNQVEKCSKRGFIFSKEIGITGIDLDDCIDRQTGEISQLSRMIIEKMNSYTEFSPSRKGFHILVWGNIPTGLGNKNSKSKIEMYDEKRFFTITGDVYQNFHTIERRQDELSHLHKIVFEKNYKRKNSFEEFKRKNRLSTTTSSFMNDDEIISRCRNSKIGEDFKEIWNGTSSRFGSKSEMDLKLIRHLSFYTQDFEQLERIWMNSPLGNRRKTQSRFDYRKRQIMEILNTLGDVYNGRRR